VGIRTRADERKFYLLGTHCAAMLKEEASKPMSKRACPLNPNQISVLIMGSNSDESVCDVVTTEDKEYCEEVSMELHPRLQVSNSQSVFSQYL
jgi:hypothetical protein